MALVTDKIVFTHLPKCGGTFVRYVFQQLNIRFHEVGEFHCPYFRIKNKLDPQLVSVISIRHPLTWYQSRWYHRMRLGWVPDAEEDWFSASNNFNKFVENMGEFDPNGRLSTLIKSFNDGPSGKADHIIRQENLNCELLEVLNLYYDFNIDFYKSLQNQNVSGDETRSSWDVAVYDEDIKRRMLSREKYVINTYYNGVIDPKNLFEDVFL